MKKDEVKLYILKEKALGMCWSVKKASYRI